MTDTPALSPQVYHILLSLARGPRHGYAMILEIRDRTNGRIDIAAGTLYAAMRRLLDDGLIQESAPPSRESDSDDRRKYYRLTQKGRKTVRHEAYRLAAEARMAVDLKIVKDLDV